MGEHIGLSRHEEDTPKVLQSRSAHEEPGVLEPKAVDCAK